MRSLILSVLSLGTAQAIVYPRDSNRTAPPCRATPGGPGWPSTDVWTKLNDTVGGRLLKPSPPGAVCHPTQPSFSSTKCDEVRSNWTNEFFHSDSPVSVEWNNWTNDTCLPDASFTCSGEGYPVYVINATTPQHVKAGIDFARKNNIRVIVKNSGHDYVGRSTAPNSLSIWVHHMKGIEVHEKSFTPKSCNITIDGPAISALAGTQMLEAYETTALTNHTVIGGNGRTVALGGFITGAGHSILAPHYGLATDQVLEMEIVSPTGEILTLNECQNTDLFWAMRGGGGSTFGVLTSVTMKIIPSPEVMSMTFWVATGANNTKAFDMIAYLVSQFPRLADAGVSGYPIIFNTVPNFIDNSNSYIKGVVGKVIMLNTRNATDLTGLFTPLFKHINATWPQIYANYNTTHYANFNAWYRDNYDPSPTGHENMMASRLLDENALTADISELKIALAKFSAAGQATVYIVSGKGVHEAKPRGGSNAVLPVWRRTYVHATASIEFLPQNEGAKTVAKIATEFFSSAMRDLAPDTGAYMNEASKFEPNWQQTFWGDNYARLLKIKRSVDPDDVFWCTPCVGSERWEELDGGKLCRT